MLDSKANLEVHQGLRPPEIQIQGAVHLGNIRVKESRRCKMSDCYILRIQQGILARRQQAGYQSKTEETSLDMLPRTFINSFRQRG